MYVAFARGRFFAAELESRLFHAMANELEDFDVTREVEGVTELHENEVVSFDPENAMFRKLRRSRIGPVELVEIANDYSLEQ